MWWSILYSSAELLTDCPCLDQFSDEDWRRLNLFPKLKSRIRNGEILLDHGADVNSRAKDSDVTPLMLASNIDVFKFQLQQNVLMRQIGNRNHTLLIVKLLVEKYHFDVKQRDKNGTPVLTFALKAGNLEVVNYLVEKGAASGISDIDEYVQKFSNPQFWRCLLKYGLQADEHGKNILFYAKPNKLSMLLQMGADASVVANDGTTLLMNSELDYNAFRLLVEHGADPGKAPGGAQGLFTWWLNQESKLEREDILLYLMQNHSLDPDARNKDGRQRCFMPGLQYRISWTSEPVLIWWTTQATRFSCIGSEEVLMLEYRNLFSRI